MTQATTDALREQLEDFGATPEEIAEHMQKLGISGKPDSTDSCPTYNLIRQLGYDVACVDGKFAYITITSHDATRSTSVLLPKAFREFVTEFDDETLFDSHPELYPESWAKPL